MWVFFYVSEKRIRQLASQILPDLPVEIAQERQATTAGSGSATVSPGSIAKILGIEGKLEGDLSRTVSTRDTSKQVTSDERVLSQVLTHLAERQDVTALDSASRTATLGTLSRLIRFTGHMVPDIEGKDAADRLAQYASSDWLRWTCSCGEIDVILTTNRAGFVGPTPVIQCLTLERPSLLVDGFAICDGRVDGSRIEAVPLILGLDLDG